VVEYIAIVKPNTKEGIKMKIPYEYFCNGCGQLRLKLNHTDNCGNCGSSNIVKGKMGKLDKDKLKKQWTETFVDCADFRGY